MEYMNAPMKQMEAKSIIEDARFEIRNQESNAFNNAILYIDNKLREIVKTSHFMFNKTFCIPLNHDIFYQVEIEKIARHYREIGFNAGIRYYSHKKEIVFDFADD